MGEAEKAEHIAIALSSDNNYLRYLTTAMASILLKSRPQDTIDFYILDGGITEENRAKIANLRRVRPFGITYYTVDPTQFADCPPLALGPHTNVVTYYRFLLGRLITHIDKILYLDCDVIATGSLHQLWQTDLGDYYAAAAKDEWSYINEYKHKMGFALDDFFFNSGVVLLNLKKWRQEDVTKKLFENRQRLNELGVFETGDQDTFNYTFKGNVAPLAWYWNVQQSTFWGRKEEAVKLRNEAVIIHFNGPEKPDKDVCEHAFRDDWWRSNQLTDFYTAPPIAPQVLAPQKKNPWRLLWQYENKANEVFLRIFRITLLKVEYRRRFAFKLLGIPILTAESIGEKIRTRLLGIPLT